MKPLTKDNLIPYAEYEQVREAFRRRIIELKRRRRISVGDKITLIFENRDTVQFQIQEMIRTERIVDPAKVQDELDVYNALLPREGELSATMFIEITDNQQIKTELDAFQGIDQGRAIALQVGSQLVYGDFERGRSKEDKISTVHFVIFRPGVDWIEELKRPERTVRVVIDHPRYRREADVPVELRQEWLADLQMNDVSARAG